MPNLQKLLRSSFGYASIVSFAVFIALSPALLRAPLPHLTSRFHAEPVSLLLIAMRELILVMPAVMAITTGLAWWALRKGLPSARSRALAASLSCLVMSTPFLVADIAIVRYSLGGPVEIRWSPGSFCHTLVARSRRPRRLQQAQLVGCTSSPAPIRTCRWRTHSGRVEISN